MGKKFDPYYEWLGIPPKDQPPNHYRLLGIELFEENRNVIDTAANRQMSFIKEYQAGPHSELTQRLLNELAAARLCLLNKEQKAAYDEALRAKLTASVPGSRPPPLRSGRKIQGAPKEATVTREGEEVVHLSVPMTPPIASEPVLPPLCEGSPSGLPGQASVPSRTPLLAESTTRAVVPLDVPAKPFRMAGVVFGVAVGLTFAALAVLLAMWAGSAMTGSRSLERDTAQVADESSSHAVRNLVETPDVQDQAASPADDADAPKEDPPTSETATARGGQTDAGASPVTSAPGLPSVGGLADAQPASFNAPRAPPILTEQKEPRPEAGGPDRPAVGITNPEPRTLRPERLQPPARDAQDILVVRINERFHPDQAVAPAAKTRLAKDLLDAADRVPRKPDERFVLLRTAAELSCDGGDVALMMQTIDQLAADYDVPEPDVHAHMLKRLLGDGKKPERVMAFLRNCDAVIRRAMAVDKLDLAVEIADLAGGFCDRPVGSVEFRKEIQERQARVRRIGEQFQQYQAALARLAAVPDDADAHATAGRWLCLVKGNWEAGLPHLNQGSEPRLKRLAERELSAADANPDVLVALGDGWCEMAQSAEAYEQLPILRRADDCYRRAAEALSGSARAEVDRRREAIGQELARLAPAEVQPTGLPDAAKPSPAAAEESESGDLQDLFERALSAGMRGNDFARAERLLSRCNQLDPQHVPTLNNLALMNLRLRNYRRAVHLWETAAGLAPENAEIKHNLQCLLRLAQANRLPLERSLVSSVERLCGQAGGHGAPGGGSYDGWLFLPSGQSRSYDSSYSDHRCLYCGGKGAVACNASGCNGGSIGVQRSEVVGRAQNGMPIVKKFTVRERCGRCYGRGIIDCPMCGGAGRLSF